jgi:hypothetical protein
LVGVVVGPGAAESAQMVALAAVAVVVNSEETAATVVVVLAAHPVMGLAVLVRLSFSGRRVTDGYL